MKIGVIADDFTGATDIASFLVLNGLRTIQLCGVSEDINLPDNIEAVVISHKTRSCPVQEAIDESLKSAKWLKQRGCEQIYFKYCSTFDSNKNGNIGPVTDALMEYLGVDFTIFQPALPVNGRTVYKGYLFAGDCLLQDSGMAHHPITPMTDSYIVRLVQMQSKGKCGVVDNLVLEKGVDAIKERIQSLKEQGYKYACLDALNEEHLLVQGQVFAKYPLVTGGSGLAIGLAQALSDQKTSVQDIQKDGYPKGEKAVVFSGSCSVMTNKQVATYKKEAPSKIINVDDLFNKNLDEYLQEFTDFVMHNQNNGLAPLVYATAEQDKLLEIQNKYGKESSSKAIENFFAKLSQKLKACGIERFIVAGGETSGIVTKSLDVQGFYIGPAIAPGVPWVRSINNNISLTLKSGNFGDEDFFKKAQTNFRI